MKKRVEYRTRDECKTWVSSRCIGHNGSYLW